MGWSTENPAGEEVGTTPLRCFPDDVVVRQEKLLTLLIYPRVLKPSFTPTLDKFANRCHTCRMHARVVVRIEGSDEPGRNRGEIHLDVAAAGPFGEVVENRIE